MSNCKYNRPVLSALLKGRRDMSLLIPVFLVGCGLFLICETAPVQNENRHAMMYLMQFGWLDPASKKMPNSNSPESLIDMRKPIMEFQSFAGLNVTGELDEETISLMQAPRCGVKDKVGHESRRRKRYVLQGSRWKVKELTYRIEQYPSSSKRLSKRDVDAEIAAAFKVWEDHSNLVFSQKETGKVHIVIRFETGEHGDGDPFDGEGGTLAHAYFPVFGGDAHFDDAEKWTIKSYTGTNLFQVAAHEFGHSLGLSHSDKRSALMAPFYRGYKPSFVLDQDDIDGIQNLYGKKSIPTAPKPKPIKPPTSSTSSKNSKLCNNPRIDAVTTMADGSTYAFRGDEVYKLTENGIAAGFPRKIRTQFPALPNDLDAAFTWSNDKTYFFKGGKYWRYSGTGQEQTLDPGYPKEIGEGFAGIPDSVDTAFVWSGNGKIYFFKGTKYWRFDPQKDPPVSPGYPKPIENWSGIPQGVDAALRYSNGYTYFFKGKEYWRFNDRNFQVDKADPAFPRQIGEWWFGCGKSMRANKDSKDYQDDGEEETGGLGRSGSISKRLTGATPTLLPLLLLLLLNRVTLLI